MKLTKSKDFQIFDEKAVLSFSIVSRSLSAYVSISVGTIITLCRAWSCVCSPETKIKVEGSFSLSEMVVRKGSNRCGEYGLGPSRGKKEERPTTSLHHFSTTARLRLAWPFCYQTSRHPFKTLKITLYISPFD